MLNLLQQIPLATVFTEIPLAAFLGLGLAMFALGGLGVLIRKNPVVVFMCIELMLNAVNLSFLAFAAYPNPSVAGQDPVQSAMAGQAMVMIVMAIAAAEVAVGLGIIMAIFRYRNQVDVDDMNTMRG